MQEVWVKLEEHPDYEISNFGNARSLKRGRIYNLKLNIDTHGYYYIIPYVNKKTYTHYKIHRLVAKYFVNGYEKGLVVNHKDGNKLNNVYTNLEWVTPSENNLHAFRIGLKRRYVSDNCRKKCIEATSIPIIVTDLATNTSRHFRSYKSAAQELGATDAGLAYAQKVGRAYKGRYLITRRNK